MILCALIKNGNCFTIASLHTTGKVEPSSAASSGGKHRVWKNASPWWMCEFVTVKLWKWLKNDNNGQIVQQVVVWGRSKCRAKIAEWAPTENMTGREWWRRWSDENDSMMNRAKMMKRTRKTNLKMRKSHSNLLFRRIRWAIMTDRCRRKPRSGERVRTDDDENEEVSFKFTVLSNSKVWVMLLHVTKVHQWKPWYPDI